MDSQTNLEKKFTILFHGKFIPLQGVEYIIQAAKILESDKGIEFKIIGDGQTFSAISQLVQKLGLTNVSFLGKKPINELPDFLSRADICLGIFGNTQKNTRVIPNKVYEAAAMAKAIISADTPAIRELFTDREDILLCWRADARDLADKILELKNNRQLREKIADGAYELFTKKATPEIIGQNLLESLKF